TEPIHLNAYISAHPLAEPYSVYISRNRVSKLDRDKLRSSLAAAQDAYFNTDREHAVGAFRSVLKHRLNSQWEALDQKALLFSALRVFELEENPRAKQQALNLSIILGHPEDVDRSVFSPNTVSQFSVAHKKQSTLTVPVTGWMKRFEYLAYEGRLIKLSGKSRILLPKTNVESLISFYSSTAKAFHIVAKTEALISLNHQIQDLVDPTCRTNASSNLKVIVVDKDKLCGNPGPIASKGSQITKSQQIDFTNSNKTQRPISLRQLGPSKRTPEGLGMLDGGTSSKTKAPRSWWQNKWLWIGIGAVATSVVIYDQQNQPDSSSKNRKSAQPTSTYER
ncbi:MAG: hypothetical protein AAF202_06840, partial [Pseudomonadota bacterium]